MKMAETRLLRGALIDRRTALLLATDIAAVTSSFILAYAIAPPLKEVVFGQAAAPMAYFRDYVWLLLFIYPLFIFFLFYRGLYEGGATSGNGRAVIGVLYTSLITLTFLALFMFLFKIQYISRFMILVFSGLTVLTTLLFRTLFRCAEPLLRKLEGSPGRMLIIGSRGRARDLLEAIRNTANVQVIGCADPDAGCLGKRVGTTQVIGTLDDPRMLLAKNHPDFIVIAMPLDKIPRVEEFLDSTEEIGVPVMIMPNYHLTRHRKKPSLSSMSIRNYHGIPMLTLSTTIHPKPALLLKRIVDLVLSGILIVITSPLLLAIGALVKLTSRGPVFYRWNVTGKGGREFTSYKFRTMVEGADRLKADYLDDNEMNGPVFKLTNDPRITRTGRWLRKFSLDELPQLYSVFKGDMSLVGPRPPLRTETERFEFWQRRKLSVKPGMTCLWQVNGRNEISDFDEWVRLDLQYIDNWSLGLDFLILAKTIPAVLRGTGR
jgi:exopolysaccharide biosynthesis polyprenyl glycosylphosphotransferase